MSRRLLVIPIVLSLGLSWAPPARPDPSPQEPDDRTKVNWVSYAQALAHGEDNGRGVFIYFLAKGQKADHEVLTTRSMAAFSREYPCVKVPHHPDDPLRQDFEVTDRTTVVITDWFGNEVKRIVLKSKSPTSPFPLAEVQGTVKNMPAIMKGLQKKLSLKVLKGRGRLRRGEYRAAIETFREVLRYEGYPAGKKAEKGIEEACAAGDDVILEAFKQGETAPEEAIATLKGLMEEFKGTRVEAGARDAIEKIRKIAEKKKREEE